MKTNIKNRKTPHAVSRTIFGTDGVEVHLAWCFKDEDDHDGPIIQKYIPLTNSYCRSGRQDYYDYSFKEKDLRSYHVDVWNQMCSNYRKVGKFMTNYQYNEMIEASSLTHVFDKSYSDGGETIFVKVKRRTQNGETEETYNLLPFFE